MNARALLTAGLICVAVGACGRVGAVATRRATPPPSTTSTSVPRYAPFPGDWDEHAGGLTIAEDGTFTVEVRTYAWCDDATHRSPVACDWIDADDFIHSGTTGRGRLTAVTGHHAEGVVTAGTNPRRFGPGTRLSFDYDAQLDTLRVTQRGSDDLFCGPRSPATTCGA
jgi:hypothetical protein